MRNSHVMFIVMLGLMGIMCSGLVHYKIMSDELWAVVHPHRLMEITSQLGLGCLIQTGRVSGRERESQWHSARAITPKSQN